MCITETPFFPRPGSLRRKVGLLRCSGHSAWISTPTLMDSLLVLGPAPNVLYFLHCAPVFPAASRDDTKYFPFFLLSERQACNHKRCMTAPRILLNLHRLRPVEIVIFGLHG